MSQQLIFVVETNSQNKSDWIYIKETIDHFYNTRDVKLSPVYMDGKTKYQKKTKEITKLISRFKGASKNNTSRIIFCFDTDNIDNSPQDNRFFEDVKQYCMTNHLDLIWFCRDIENVYLGKTVPDKDKKKEADSFKRQNQILYVNSVKLNSTVVRNNTSNILPILDQYLRRK